jgi:hypothetical protein
VNGEVAHNVSSLNDRAGYHDVVPVELNLREGPVNKIMIGLSGNIEGEGARIVIDGIEVVED